MRLCNGDPNDVALRADQAGDEFGKPSCSGADVEDVLAGLEGERTDQELAVVKLNDPGLFIGAGKFWSIPFKTDRSGRLWHCQCPSPLCLTRLRVKPNASDSTSALAMLSMK
jgi:hypothetical protein